MQMASMSAMNVVPRMNPSTASKARRAMASAVSPDFCGTNPRSEATARSESRRKKKISSIASTAVATISPTIPSPASTPEAAVPPNLPNNSWALSPRSPRLVPCPPNFSTRSVAARCTDDTICSPLSISAFTTIQDAPPTTATTAAQVSPAVSDLLTFILISRRYSGPSSAVPSSASSTGVTAVLKVTHNQIPTATTPVTSSTTAHQAAIRRAGSGRSGLRVDCMQPPEHGPETPALPRGPSEGRPFQGRGELREQPNNKPRGERFR
ncbi:hypothetical protein GCM10010329_20010 [Streptomyces spiroverticillatus]|uniref:Uncharacterized protein n=1 Tax=Streptomyces finlayi TaxID=67296 RepID=A0A918WUA1_9ACTN|nr:hypothetical protein GCM10010329_20010 [Streptomyces spiroverticillatus]GHC83373.1 hypothetical protein GCM10010334_12450 [Streptomyces finlayi]